MEGKTMGFLNKLNNILSKYGKVYIDLLHNNSNDKQKRVMSELEKCDEIILIETENILKFHWVKIEIEKAKYLKKNNKQIFSCRDIPTYR